MVLFRRLLGEVLRRHRQRQGRTLRDVATAARVSLGYLSEVERGVKEASSELLTSLCDALGVTLADVLREVSDELIARERRPLRPVGFVTSGRGASRAVSRPVAGVAPMVAGRAAVSAVGRDAAVGDAVEGRVAAPSALLAEVPPVGSVTSLSVRGMPVVAA
ncbi:MAG: hypothetical protein QOC82_100 [Frankiaceae bacterium]|jgi:transcriptional regulator with XRE-family HTH domain|nr:hypothetical protein [Frankiaceae bacterium]